MDEDTVVCIDEDIEEDDFDLDPEEYTDWHEAVDEAFGDDIYEDD